MYQHHNWQGALLDYPVSKVVCVGSNYAKHMKVTVSSSPLCNGPTPSGVPVNTTSP
ncbi:hypothetical protein ACUN90_17790, partial [Escherichia sp. SP-MK2]